MICNFYVFGIEKNYDAKNVMPLILSDRQLPSSKIWQQFKIYLAIFRHCCIIRTIPIWLFCKARSRGVASSCDPWRTMIFGFISWICTPSSLPGSARSSKTASWPTSAKIWRALEFWKIFDQVLDKLKANELVWFDEWKLITFSVKNGYSDKQHCLQKIRPT